jgi:tetratricopeptide (TPR) repeat protein
MKVVHKQEESIADLLAQGKEAESAKEWGDAEKSYHRILKRDNNNLHAFQRLMIIYRKQKLFTEELSVINKAIDAFSKLYEPKTAHSKRVQTLSAKINKAFGMVDRKGKSLYEPGPVATWKKRKILVEKRLRK